jgi:hypothetical protein
MVWIDHYCIVDTPGSGNVVRIVNTATVEFPMAASVQAYSLGDYSDGDYMEPVMGDGGGSGSMGGLGQW